MPICRWLASACLLAQPHPIAYKAFEILNIRYFSAAFLPKLRRDSDFCPLAQRLRHNILHFASYNESYTFYRTAPELSPYRKGRIAMREIQ